VRQRGSKFRPGRNAKLGGDDTIFAAVEGRVKYRFKRTRRFDRSFRETVYVDIMPLTKKSA